MSLMAKIVSTCHCGRNRYTFSVSEEELPLPAQLCHCSQCRHITGGLCYSGASVPPDQKPDLSALSHYDFSSKVRTYFCPNCSTLMFWNRHSPTGKLSLSSGIIENASDILDYGAHIWLEDTRDGGAANWIDRVGTVTMTRYQKGASYGQIAPPIPSSKQTQSNHVNTDILKASCLCGGVSFNIKRPSAAPASSNIDGEPWWKGTNDRYFATSCACHDCRVFTGTPFTALTYAPSTAISFADGMPFTWTHGTLKTYRSSDTATRAFCSGCGASVFFGADAFNKDDHTGFIGIAVGLLNGSSGVLAQDWLVWKVWGVSRSDGANHKPLIEAMTAGLKKWGDETYGSTSYLLFQEGTTPVFQKIAKAAKNM